MIPIDPLAPTTIGMFVLFSVCSLILGDSSTFHGPNPIAALRPNIPKAPLQMLRTYLNRLAQFAQPPPHHRAEGEEAERERHARRLDRDADDVYFWLHRSGSS
ncbi:MAG TPA: hypothetical protein VMD79_08520 [Solirubrobacteraceae bacterium]|nr:hypothetical protein [Solirubrobacteraceae bacterium]